MTDPTWYLTPAQQTGSLAAMAVVVAAIIFGIWSLAAECLDRWSVADVDAATDELADDLMLGRDSHAEVGVAMQEARAGR